MKTILEANHPITHVLLEAVKYLNAKHDTEQFRINCANDKQANFMETCYQPKDLNTFSSSELKSKVSVFVAEINSWLKQYGYDIQLQETNDPNGFAVGSILEIATKWHNEGKETTLKGQSIEYKAFSLEPHYEKTSIYDLREETFPAFKISNYGNPVIVFSTKNGDIVHLLEADQSKELKKPTEMYRFVGESICEKFPGISKIVLPELDLDMQPNISWLRDMQFKSNHNLYLISEALQQIKFKMNKVGAEVKTAVAISGISGSLYMGPRNFTWYFDKPFYMWLTRPGTSQPYFSGYIGLESFLKI